MRPMSLRERKKVAWLKKKKDVVGETKKGDDLDGSKKIEKKDK